MSCTLLFLFLRTLFSLFARRKLNPRLRGPFCCIFKFPLRVFMSLNLRCRSYLHEQIDLPHSHIRAIWADQQQRHPIALFVCRRLRDVQFVQPLLQKGKMVVLSKSGGSSKSVAVDYNVGHAEMPETAISHPGLH